MIGSAIGLGGGIASIADKVLNKDDGLVESLFNLCGDSSLAKAVNSGATWGSVFGAGISSIGDTIKDKIGSAFKVPKTNLGKFSMVAKWAGKLINLGTTIVDNYKEYGFSGNMLKATAVDLGVDFVVDIAFDVLAVGLCTAVAAAATAVAGAVAAPAVIAVAGAVAVAASSDVGQAVVSTVTHSVADFICEKKTGKKVNEYVSDKIMDTIEDEEYNFSEGDGKRRSVEAGGGRRRSLINN